MNELEILIEERKKVEEFITRVSEMSVDEWNRNGSSEYYYRLDSIMKLWCRTKADLDAAIDKVSGKKAVLVTFSLCTRVIVDKDADEDDIVEAARGNIFSKVGTCLGENVMDVVDDVDCPYDPETDGI